MSQIGADGAWSGEYFSVSLEESASASRILRLILDGREVELTPETQGPFSQRLDEGLQDIDRQLQLQRQMQPWITEQLVRAGLEMESAAEAYLDWYFSLQGSTQRLMAVMFEENADAFVQAQLNDMLEDSNIAAVIDQMQSDLPARFEHKYQNQLDQLTRDLADEFGAERAVQTPLEDTSLNLPTLNLDEALSTEFRPYLDDRLRWVTTLGFGAGTGLSSTVIARQVAARAMRSQAMRAASQAIASLITRLGVGGVSAVTRGGASAAVTSPSGPGAAITFMAVTGVSVGTVVAAEYAQIKAQEMRYRPGMQRALEDEIWVALDRIRMQTEADLAAASQQMGDASRDRVRKSQQERELPEEYRILG